MTKLNPHTVGLALAIVTGIFFGACVLAFTLFPTQALAIADAIFHGIDLNQLVETAVPFSTVVVGFVSIVIYAYIAGLVFAWVYNYLTKK